jgi:hypothetical protein
MGYYRDEPPEPENEGRDTFTCSMEVTRKFVTPDMERELTILRDGPKINDPWAAARFPEEVEIAKERSTRNAVQALLRAWKHAEEHTGTCGWEGETDYAVWNDSIQWACPSCGEEHDDESAQDRWGPDPDALREQMMEEQYDSMREDDVIERLRQDEEGM